MRKIVIFPLCLLLASCSRMELPQEFEQRSDGPSIYPDYTDITIPYNIAPLNFHIQEEGERFMAVARSRTGQQLVADGADICWSIDRWHKLLDGCQGDTLFMDIYTFVEGKWLRYAPIRNYVAPEPIDTYLSYRLIEPSFAMYEHISINQRNLTNFDEQVIFNNGRPVEDSRGKCINCHSYQDYNRSGRMQFHIREYKGGTLIVDGGKVRKVNMKVGNLLSGGAYPSWHPTQNKIAYSTNATRQRFHSKDTQKVEVMDLASDLVLYDVDQNEIRVISADPTEMETFPSWSPDGGTLYYVSAHYPDGVDVQDKDSLFAHYQDIRYDIYRRAFDMDSGIFSDPDTVFCASCEGKSATFPRISPDGRYLLFTLGDYGTFHIWHKSSDLYLMDLRTKVVSPLERANSSDVDSYHAWSSNGSWIVFSSRREDGSYTRPYFCYFKDGCASKPFLLPQKRTDYYLNVFKSFNIPEFMVKPVDVSRRAWAKAAEAPAVQAGWKGRKEGAPQK